MVEDVTTDKVCLSCIKLKQEIEIIKRDKASTIKVIKDKIISTDKLIRKYTKKCDDFDKQTKQLNDLNQIHSECKRSDADLQKQLRQALEQIEPQRKNITRLIQERFTAEETIMALRKKNEELQSAVSSLESALQQKEESEFSLMKEQEVQEMKLEKERQRVVKLQDKLKKVARERIKDKGQLRKKSRELNSLDQKSENYKTQLDKLKEKVKALKIKCKTNNQQKSIVLTSATESENHISKNRNALNNIQSPAESISHTPSKNHLFDIFEEMDELKTPTLSPLPPSQAIERSSESCDSDSNNDEEWSGLGDALELEIGDNDFEIATSVLSPLPPSQAIESSSDSCDGDSNNDEEWSGLGDALELEIGDNDFEIGTSVLSPFPPSQAIESSSDSCDGDSNNDEEWSGLGDGLELEIGDNDFEIAPPVLSPFPPSQAIEKSSDRCDGDSNNNKEWSGLGDALELEIGDNDYESSCNDSIKDRFQVNEKQTKSYEDSFGILTNSNSSENEDSPSHLDNKISGVIPDFPDNQQQQTSKRKTSLVIEKTGFTGSTILGDVSQTSFFNQFLSCDKNQTVPTTEEKSVTSSSNLKTAAKSNEEVGTDFPLDNETQNNARATSVQNKKCHQSDNVVVLNSKQEMVVIDSMKDLPTMNTERQERKKVFDNEFGDGVLCMETQISVAKDNISQQTEPDMRTSKTEDDYHNYESSSRKPIIEIQTDWNTREKQRIAHTPRFQLNTSLNPNPNDKEVYKDKDAIIGKTLLETKTLPSSNNHTYIITNSDESLNQEISSLSKNALQFQASEKKRKSEEKSSVTRMKRRKMNKANYPSQIYSSVNTPNSDLLEIFKMHEDFENKISPTKDETTMIKIKHMNEKLPTVSEQDAKINEEVKHELSSALIEEAEDLVKDFEDERNKETKDKKLSISFRKHRSREQDSGIIVSEANLNLSPKFCDGDKKTNTITESVIEGLISSKMESKGSSSEMDPREHQNSKAKELEESIFNKSKSVVLESVIESLFSNRDLSKTGKVQAMAKDLTVDRMQAAVEHSDEVCRSSEISKHPPKYSQTNPYTAIEDSQSTNSSNSEILYRTEKSSTLGICHILEDLAGVFSGLVPTLSPLPPSSPLPPIPTPTTEAERPELLSKCLFSSANVFPLSPNMVNKGTHRDSISKKTIRRKKATKSIVWLSSRPVFLSELQYATKVLRYLLKDDIKIDDIVQQLSNKCNLSSETPLAAALMVFKYNEELLPSIITFYNDRNGKAACKKEVTSNFLSRFEIRVLEIIRKLSLVEHLKKLPILVITYLSKAILYMYLKAAKEEPDKQAMTSHCRIMCSLCRDKGDLQRMRVLCYDVIRILFSRPGTVLYLIISIAAVWPAVLSYPSLAWEMTGGTVILCGPRYQPLLSTIHVVIAYLVGANDLTLIGHIIDWLCSWKHISLGVDILERLCDELVRLMEDPSFAELMDDKDGYPVLGNGLFEVVKSLELATCVLGWVWLNNVLIRRHIWNILSSWAIQAQLIICTNDIVHNENGLVGEHLVAEAELCKVDSCKINNGVNQENFRPLVSHQQHSKIIVCEATVVATIRLLGLVCRLAIEQHQSVIPHVIPMLLVILKETNYQKVTFAIHLATAFTLLDVSPWQPQEVSSALKTWIDSRPSNRLLPTSLERRLEELESSLKLKP